MLAGGCQRAAAGPRPSTCTSNRRSTSPCPRRPPVQRGDRRSRAAEGRCRLTVSVVAGQVAESARRVHRQPGAVPVHPRHGGRGVDHRRGTGGPAAPGERRGGHRVRRRRLHRHRTTRLPWSRGRSTVCPWPPQQLTAATLPQMGGKGEPDGLLGSDVLSRFGGVRVDFAAGDAGPARARGAAAGPVVSVHRPDRARRRGADGGASGTTVPLTVTPATGDVSLSVAVRFAGGAAADFVVDTGSSQSVVSLLGGPQPRRCRAPTWPSVSPPSARSSPCRSCTAGPGRCRVWRSTHS